MAEIIGIDLGTTNSCIAVLEGKEPRVIPNLEGQLTTPSVVSFTGTGEPIVGNSALRQAISNPENTISSAKRLLGKKLDSEDMNDLMKKITFRLTRCDNGDVLIALGTKKISPQEVSGIILRYLKDSAQSFLSEEVREAIITVPAHFDDHQRQATKDAAKIAGLDVLRVINEPTSASLAYGLKNTKNAKIAIYDMGGGTFDLTILEINNGVFHVLATNGNTYLGGDDFNHRIVEWMIDEFRLENKVDLKRDILALQRIRESAEKAKMDLSFQLETEISLPFIYSDTSGSKHLKKTITRDTLEYLTKDLVERSFPYLEQALKDSKLEPGQIDDVLLVGGQTRMPLIKQKIAAFFGRSPNENVNPDEVVAMGAAIQSGILSSATSNLLVLLDVTPLSLGIETENDGFETIIERNTTIPVKETKSFTTVEHDQRRVKIHVLQGEENKASKNTSLAVFNLTGINPAPAGTPQIDVTFEIDADGIVTVYGMDLATGREQFVEVSPSSGLTEEEIASIIQNASDQKTKSTNTHD